MSRSARNSARSGVTVVRQPRPVPETARPPSAASVGSVKAPDTCEGQARRKAFQRKHQRQGNVFDFLLFHNGIGKPGTDVGLPRAPRRFQLVEAEPGDHAAEEGAGLTHLAAIGLHPADEGLLHDVLGVRHRA